MKRRYAAKFFKILLFMLMAFEQGSFYILRKCMSSGELVFRTGNLEHVDFRSFGKILNWDFLEVKNIAFQKLKEIPRVRIFDGISPTTVGDMLEVDDAAE